MRAPTTRVPYTTADGKKVPSVTTIISRFKESGGLVWWAWNEGMNGRDYRQSRDSAANAGTLAHAMVEANIRGKAWQLGEGWDKDIVRTATQAFANYLEWRKQTNLTPVATEVRLVSETYRFGGTLDAMLVGGRLSLGDWKTSNSVYADYLLQLAAYGVLWEENYPDRPIEGGYHLLRFAKDEPDFAHYHFGELSVARRAFLRMRELYDDMALLEKRVK